MIERVLGELMFIPLNVATECSRNYAKNIHRGFNCSRAINMTSSFPRSMSLL
jgi:hypothetical protein